MINISDNASILNIFKPNRKCIINSDLDGLLSGMILQHFLNWEIVGFSSCTGKATDELWLEDKKINLKECVFVDLPVCIENISVIDQHFVAYDDASIKKYNQRLNKINPNIMREKVFKSSTNQNHYTEKYPFGTVHFVIAILENLGVINEKNFISLDKKIGNFDIVDLILRADRVIGNTYSYTANCLEWADWMISLGKSNTNKLFSIAKSEYSSRKIKEKFVEEELKKFGCNGLDGDCSNMLTQKDNAGLQKYFELLSTALGIKAIPILKLYNYGRLSGRILKTQYSDLKYQLGKDNMFSYAFITKSLVSVTYILNE